VFSKAARTVRSIYLHSFGCRWRQGRCAHKLASLFSGGPVTETGCVPARGWEPSEGERKLVGGRSAGRFVAMVFRPRHHEDVAEVTRTALGSEARPRIPPDFYTAEEAFAVGERELATASRPWW
jgi:hypothetical protein